MSSAVIRAEINEVWVKITQAFRKGMKVKSEKKVRRETTLDEEIEYLKGRGYKFLSYVPPTFTGYIVCETPSGLRHFIAYTAKRRNKPADTSIT